MSKWYSKLMKSALILGMSFSAFAGAASVHAEGSAREKLLAEYPAVLDQDQEAVDASDQTLRIGIASDASSTGILNMIFYSSAIDSNMIKFGMAGAFPGDELNRILTDDDTTPIKVSYDVDAKTVRYEINPDFKWNNGDPVTTADIYRTYELLANPEFIKASGHVRYGEPNK